jgi:glucose-6-phosphate 1-epimerase
MNKLEQLKNRFAALNDLCFEQTENGMILIDIDHPLATATVSLEGGQILAWQPKAQALPVLWSSDPCHWVKGRAIRAGVPICWPWFGGHPIHSDLPAHGYARVCSWEVIDIATSLSGAIEMTMCMNEDHQVPEGHTISAQLSIRISVSDTLSIELTTKHTGEKPIRLTEALHAYFNVSDIHDVRIDGLSDCRYVDLIDQQTIKTQQGDIKFSGETGRVYLNTQHDCLMIDQAYNRTIKIEKSGSQSTVVWNPWLETASKMNDLGPLAWKKMVCVESANALENSVVLHPGEQHTLTVRYSIDTIDLNGER